MEYDFYTLQDLLTHTKGVTYILMIFVLLGMIGFWRFLTERDDE